MNEQFRHLILAGVAVQEAVVLRVTALATFLEFYLAETKKMTKLKTSRKLSHFLAWVNFNHSVRSVSQQNTTVFDKVIKE